MSHRVTIICPLPLFAQTPPPPPPISSRLIPFPPLASLDLTCPIPPPQAVNLPRDSTIESVRTKFSACGAVATVRMEHTPRGATAVVEYLEHEVAFAACETLTDTKNWRGGLRVVLSGGVTIPAARKQIKKLMKKANSSNRDRDADGGEGAVDAAAAEAAAADGVNGPRSGGPGGDATGGGVGGADGAAAEASTSPTDRQHGKVQKVRF